MRTAPSRPPVARGLRALLLDWLFARPQRMRAAARLLRFAQRSGLMHVAALAGLRDAAKLAPQIPDRFFIASDQRYDVPECCRHRASARRMRHARRVSKRPRSDDPHAQPRRLCVVVPRAQGCCGAIAVHAGEGDFARELAKMNIAAFERSGADVYVVNAAGCGSALKEYGTLLAEDPAWAGRATAFASRVRDITEVLDAMDLAPRPHRSCERMSRTRSRVTSYTRSASAPRRAGS